MVHPETEGGEKEKYFLAEHTIMTKQKNPHKHFYERRVPLLPLRLHLLLRRRRKENRLRTYNSPDLAWRHPDTGLGRMVDLLGM